MSDEKNDDEVTWTQESAGGPRLVVHRGGVTACGHCGTEIGPVAGGQDGPFCPKCGDLGEGNVFIIA